MNIGLHLCITTILFTFSLYASTDSEEEKTYPKRETRPIRIVRIPIEEMDTKGTLIKSRALSRTKGKQSDSHMNLKEKQSKNN